ncbi:hypothetical protein F2Q68_00015747 [Brassica cretica]|uniref:Uncharacterized protein n=2 Tax=Brassica cretica TaxID=69181 RepID=A0ABQ7EZ14_BRACR|nr:hypothetical protein F2Q68_00015747 [Brassica cretica]KAF3608567.1 hypothetical protein DY000_02048327 [Brassica cretica]
MRDGEEKIRKRGGLLLEELAEDQLRRGIGTEEITASRRTQWDRAREKTARRRRRTDRDIKPSQTHGGGKEKPATKGKRSWRRRERRWSEREDGVREKSDSSKERTSFGFVETPSKRETQKITVQYHAST